jgi:hypothetical protein
VNTRIFSASLFCVALACLTIPASAQWPAVRPEIAQHLIIAGFSPPVYAKKEISAAEAVPNQTAEEKRRVAGAKAMLMGDFGFPLCDTNCSTIHEGPLPPPNYFQDHPPNNISPSH